MNPAETLVVDTSVAVKWYLKENDSEAALALLRRSPAFIAPDLMAVEVGNVFRNKVRKGLLTATEADERMATFLRDHPVRLLPSSPYLTRALQIANTYDRSVYDALYLALAEAEGCQMVTADDRLVNALQNTPLTSRIIRLTDLAG